MEDATTDCAAFDETVVFLSYFKDLKDPRQQGKVSYPLDEILLLCLLAVLAGAEARGATIGIGGELFSDAMGPGGTYEGTYVGMIDHNATVIARALGGDAPRRGMNGKLSTVKE